MTPDTIRSRRDFLRKGVVTANAARTWAFHCHILPHAESEHGMFGMVTALVVQP